MDPVYDHLQDDQEVVRCRDRFVREREDEYSDSSTVRDDCNRDSSVRRSRKRSSSVNKNAREDERRLKRRRSISPRGGSHRASRADSDRYVPSYGRDGHSSSRSRFSGLMDPGQGAMASPGYGSPGPNKVVDPLDFNYLLTPSQFAECIMGEARYKNPRGLFSINPSELERRYGLYRESFVNKQQEMFFEMEKNSEWVREKYHPVDSLALRKEINERRLGLLKIFEDNLESGMYDSICYDEIASAVPSGASAGQEDRNEEGESKDPTHGAEAQQKEATSAQDLVKSDACDLSIFKAVDPSTNALFIRAVPPSIKREAIVDICKNIKGFKYLCLSDPKPEKDMHRLGWIVFDKDTDMEAAYRSFDGQSLDNFTFHVQSHKDVGQRVRLISSESNTKERLEKDLEQIKELARVLEGEVGVPEGHGTSRIEERVEKVLGEAPASQDQDDPQDGEDESARVARVKLALDLHITYLRCVHQYDYYGSIECTSSEDFCRKSFIYLRRSTADRFSKKGWAEQLDFRTRLRVEKPISGHDILKIGGRPLDVDLENGLSKYVKKEGEGKRRCRHCGKLFKAGQFVRKHIKLKHPAIASGIEEEVIFFNNFVRDQQRADSFRYYLNAGGSIVNLGMRGQLQMGQNLLLGGVTPQLPGLLSMMPGQIPGMGKNMNLVALNALMMNLSRMHQKTSMMGGVYPGGFPRQQHGERGGYYPGGDRDGYHPRPARDRSDYRFNSSRWNMSYKDLDAAEYEGDLRIVYD